MIIKSRQCAQLCQPYFIHLLLLSIAFFLLASCTTVASPSALSTSVDGSEAAWTVEGGNPQRSRATAADIEPPLRLRTTFELGRETKLVSPPVVSSEMLVADSDKRLSGFNLASRTEEWFINLAGSYLSPVIVEDLVLVRAEADGEGYLIALNGDAATIAWEYKFPMVGSQVHKLGGHVTAPLALADTVYVGAAQTMNALQLNSGELLWQFQTNDPIASAASADDGQLYFSDFSNLYAVDMASGDEVWRFPFGDSASLLFAPIVAEQGVLITQGDIAHFVDKADGASLWSRQFDGEAIIPAAATDSVVLVKAANSLTALDVEGGSTQWTFSVNDFVSLPVATKEHLYVITRTGGESQLRSLSLADGQEAWRLDGETLSNAAPISAGDSILVRSEDGRILVYGE